MQPQWPSNQPPATPSETKPTSRLSLVIGLVIVIAGLLATLVFVMAGDDETAANKNAATYVVTQAASVPPVFEERAAEGENSFFPIDVQLAGLAKQTGKATSAELVESGLYGGTVENTCDPERLIAYLYDNPDKGEAWASVQEIPFGQIGTYIRSLDARVLSTSATVVNHGYDERTGAPTAIKTTLEAGTAVLVDANGDIRTRCYCGNPVKPMPPVFKEPRCLVSPALVYTRAGGEQLRSGASNQVELSGRVAASGADRWSEVTWGDAVVKTGWVSDTNLQATLCKAVVETGGQCAQPGAAVWANATDIDQVGQLGGEVRAAVIQVGGVRAALTTDGFVLINFTQPAPSDSNSAWVRSSDLEPGSCETVAVCLDTQGAVRARAGGAEVRPTGNYLVSFTGHNVTGPTPAAEVRFADGARGWISNDYEPLANSACDPPIPPERVRCVTGLSPLMRLEDGEPVITGLAGEAPVYLTQADPVDGLVEVELNPNGELAWIDQAALSPAGDCPPRRVCWTIGAVRSPRATSGELVDLHPGPRYVDVFDIEYVPSVAQEPYLLVGVGGRQGWLRLNDPVNATAYSCGQDQAVPGPTVVPSPVVEPSTAPTVTATAEPQPTATVAPATPAPTSAPQPTPPTPPPTAATPAPVPTEEPEPSPAPTCPDADGDGICNADDNCRDVANADQADVDNDDKGNACDQCTDVDGDLHCSETDDTCPNDYDPGLMDTDKDGVGDVCDNCPNVSNPAQADTNDNGIGNTCEEGAGRDGCQASTYFGLTRFEAEQRAGANNCIWRIRRIDNETFPGTTDFVPDRLNFEIDNRIVTQVNLG